MPSFQRKQLEFEFDRVKAYFGSLGHALAGVEIPNDKVLNLGCSLGYETIALSWYMDAAEAIGFDLEITNAEQIKLELIAYVDECNQVMEILRNTNAPRWEALRYFKMTDDDLKWWENDVPRFIKEKRLPNYIQGDVRHFKFGFNNIDLVYCSNVLYQIYNNQGGEKAVIVALRNLRNALKSGKWMVASEPTELKFVPLFNQVFIKQRVIRVDNKTIYLYTNR